MNEHLALVIAAGSGVIGRRDHPELGRQLDWLCRTGELVRVLPGVYAVPEAAASFDGRVRAVSHWRPDVVITGRSAARLLFWPTLSAPVVDLCPVQRRDALPGFRLSERRIHPDLVVSTNSLRVASPALTALDLCAELGGDPIDLVLRTRRATLTGLHAALELSAHRAGNRRRRQLLLESRDEPWSGAERRAHALLHSARIRGWRSNLPVLVGGQRYFIDIAFPGAHLAVEIDGREFHSDAAVFESDRQRQNALVCAGWRVLRFTWRMLVDHPDHVLELIRSELARAHRSRRSGGLSSRSQTRP